jgi:hypothetical protein
VQAYRNVPSLQGSDVNLQAAAESRLLAYKCVVNSGNGTAITLKRINIIIYVG